jgi:hypothetical protein
LKQIHIDRIELRIPRSHVSGRRQAADLAHSTAKHLAKIVGRGGEQSYFTPSGPVRIAARGATPNPPQIAGAIHSGITTKPARRPN